jgi:predicted neuraminidase
MVKFQFQDSLRIYGKTLNPPASHSATLAELNDETLYCVWYSGSYEGAKDTVLYASSLTLEDEWSTPQVIVEIPGLPTGNPVLWYEPKEQVLNLYFVILYGDWWTESKLAHVKSLDNGKTWSQAKILHDKKGLMPRTPLLTLESGTVLFPIYDEKNWAPLILRSEDGGQTWDLVGDTTASGKAIQPTLAALPDGRVLMLSRTNKGCVFRSVSINDGQSWTASQPLDEPNPNSSIDIVPANFEGKDCLIMISNPTAKGRGLLTLSVSWDNGVTWNGHTPVFEGDGEYSYPTMIPAKEGGAHLVFTEDRMTIRYCYVDIQEWLSTITQ